MPKKKIFRTLTTLAFFMPGTFLASCFAKKDFIFPIENLIIPDFFDNSPNFKKQKLRSFDLYASEVNAIKLKWFLNTDSLLGLSKAQKNQIFASNFGKFFVFDNNEGISVVEEKFDINQKITPKFLKIMTQKAKNKFSVIPENEDSNLQKTVNSGKNNASEIAIFKELSQLFSPNWRFIDMKLVKPNIVFDDQKNYLLITAYKIFYSNPIIKYDQENEKKTDLTSKISEKWSISAPNQLPTPSFRLYWLERNAKKRFTMKLNSKENVNSEYDLQLINNADQPESVEDFAYNFGDEKPTKPELPLEKERKEPLIRIVSQSFLIPFEGQVADFEGENFKFKYLFN
ncbi:hypothetical protein [Mycoplasma sp. 'Moose RK']|uniref:hypothetical protein n=1 Tax=Mycoplasma sp. 'Moose RK' TaxID=2780095 RepID=UPI0018C21571|nr:hypothetical protein [Mycoplasma sp. 'Moose RK']MBG0730659.1 hypothetical protein [Mycoplasma sp. 'Moose RK']